MIEAATVIRFSDCNVSYLRHQLHEGHFLSMCSAMAIHSSGVLGHVMTSSLYSLTMASLTFFAITDIAFCDTLKLYFILE